MRNHTTIQHRRGTEGEWNAANPVLAFGEIGVEATGTIIRHKVGDGATPWQGLPYAQGTPGDKGDPGQSAYQVAVAGGFVGTESQWIASLKGTPGAKGETGSVELTGAVPEISVGATTLNVGGRQVFLAQGTAEATNGQNLNNFYGPSRAGSWEVYKWSGGPINLPADFTGRGVLEVFSNTSNATTQRLVNREDARSWTRTCRDQNVTPTLWSDWRPDRNAIASTAALNGVNLNDVLAQDKAGPYEVYAWTGGPIGLPAGFSGRGTFEVISISSSATTQRVAERDTGIIWSRTCTDPIAKTWTAWSTNAVLTESMRTSMAIAGDSLAASHNLRESLMSEIAGVNIYSRAWNGATSDEVLLRLGVKTPVWKISGGQIPSTATDVSVTTVERLDFLTENTYLTGKLAGIAGRLTKTGSAWVFRRDEAGSAVAASTARWNPDWSASTSRHSIGLIVGRNDVSAGHTGVESSVVDHLIANIDMLIDWMDARRQLVFLMGTINRTTEPRGTEGYETVTEYNRRLRERYPGKTVLVRDYLVNQAIYDLEITPTQQDLDNMENDCPPPSVMVDVTHYSDAAAAAISRNVLKPWLQAKGYI